VSASSGRGWLATWVREVRRGRGRACIGAPKGVRVAAVSRGGATWAAFLGVCAHGGGGVGFRVDGR
jgi:hypothetical protein